MTRIAHLTDTHLNGSADRRDRLGRALDAARQAGADHLLLTGDLTASGHPSQFQELGDVLVGWPEDQITIVPGNHDGDRDWRDLTGPLERFAPTSQTGAVVDRGDVWIVAIDSRLARRAPAFAALGAVDQAQMTRLERVIGAAPLGVAVVIAMHHGPQWHMLQAFDGLTSSHQINGLLRRSKSIAVCCGHDHRILDLEGQVFTAASVVDHEEPLRLYDIREGRLVPVYQSRNLGRYMSGLHGFLMVAAHNKPPEAIGGDAILNSLVRLGSRSTGSLAGDGLLGALAGYASAPPDAKWKYAAGGAVATGLCGLFGLLGTVGWGLRGRARKRLP